MFPAKIMLDSTGAQIWPGDRKSDRAIPRNDTDIPGSINEDAITGEKFVDFVELGNETVEKSFQLWNETFGQISDLTTHACVGRRKTGAAQQFEEVIEFLALGEGLQKNGHRAKVERHCPESQEMG